MNEETKKALELARQLLWSAAGNTYADRVRGITAIDVALAAAPAAPVAPAGSLAELESICRAADAGAGGWVATSRLRELIATAPSPAPAPAAPVAQPVEWLRTLLDAVMDFRHTPEGMVRGGEYVRADALIDMAALRAAPSPAPAPQPVSEPSDAEINKLACAAGFSPVQVVTDNGAFGRFARAVLALRPASPRAPLTPRGFLLHWPKPGGGRTLLWHETDAAGVSIGCPVEPVYSYGVRAHGIGQGGA